MPPEPQTTVVIAVWDRYVARLPEALQSVREQDVVARIVVVDNASEIAIPPLEGIEVRRAERRLTLGAASNLGLTHITTPYVLFWDADDVMLPGTLAYLERQIAADPDLVAFGMAIIEDPSGRRHRWPRRWIGRLSRVERLFALLHCVWALFPTTGSTIMRTALVVDAGGYAPIDSGQDWVLGASLAFRGRFGWSERPGRIYRLHADSVSAVDAGRAQLLRRARAVRDRLGSDPAVPTWVRIAVPLIGLGQRAAIALHNTWPGARRLQAARRRAGRNRFP